MILKIFAVYDIKSELYSTPFFMGTNGEAVRAFKDLANDRNTVVGRHPGDFRLTCIGAFDNITGECVTGPMDSLGFAHEYVERPAPPVHALREA